MLLILVKNHWAGGGHDRLQEDQWVAPALVRAGGLSCADSRQSGEVAKMMTLGGEQGGRGRSLG